MHRHMNYDDECINNNNIPPLFYMPKWQVTKKKKRVVFIHIGTESYGAHTHT